MQIRITKAPTVERRHGLEKRLILEATLDTERKGGTARFAAVGPLKFPGAVWVTAPRTGERVRLLSHEWEPAP